MGKQSGFSGNRKTFAIEVSADFLLKDERTIQANEERGYYVSKEMERGFIATQSYYWNIRFYVFTWCYGNVRIASEE